MLEGLKREVYEANMDLVRNGLVIYTWGNVSGIDTETQLVVIKPSGVPYDQLKPSDMVVVDLNGKIIEGKLKPSSDTATHLELYKKYSQIKGVAHTHSTYATAFAQANKSIPVCGTTHADYFNGDIICTRALTEGEVGDNYEKNTGLLICEALADKDPLEMPGILVRHHGPFSWGNSPSSSVFNSTVLEKVAEITYKTLQLTNQTDVAFPSYILMKHYNRKHGANAYYGQESGNHRDE